MFNYQYVSGDSYSLKEALYRGLPIVVCNLPYFKEIGIKDNENALFYNSDNSNAEDVAKRMKKPLKFKFKKVEDGYDEILDKTKSKYEEEKNMKAKVKALRGFEGIRDAERNVFPKTDDEWITNMERAEYLESKNVVQIIEIIKEDVDNAIERAEKIIEEENTNTTIDVKPRRRRKRSVAKD